MDTPNANIDDVLGSSKEEIKNTRNELADMLEKIKPFDAESYIADDKDLPPRQTTVINYDEIFEELSEESGRIIDVICQNYIKSDTVFTNIKVVTLRNEQKAKLADIQFLMNCSKDGLINIKEAIDSGDINPDNFRIQISFQTELRNNIELRTKHLKEVENYWKVLSEKLGMDATGETEAMEKDPTSTSKSKDNKNGNIKSHRDLNAAIEEAMKKVKKEN